MPRLYKQEMSPVPDKGLLNSPVHFRLRAGLQSWALFFWGQVLR